jgi:hypothetical protein
MLHTQNKIRLENKMKKLLLLGVSLALFSGCSYIPKSIKKITQDDGKVYKTNCGTDGCGRPYKDTTYRSYDNLDDSCNKCNNGITASQNCKPCVNSNYTKADTDKLNLPANTPVLKKNSLMRVAVIGQGVAPVNTSSPAQAYALAKRAAIADAYRLLAEKIKGVHVEGQDLIKNMMVKRSSVRTSVTAMIKNANAVETTFKEGLCEVEMEVTIAYSQFAL